MFPETLPISQAAEIAFEGDLFFPVAKPGDTTPYYVPGTKLPGFIPPPGTVLTVSVPLTAAQLLTTFSAPLTLVPAPGVGMMLVFVWSGYDVLPGNSPYINTDGGPQIWFGTPTGTAFDDYALGTLFAATAPSVAQGASQISSAVTARANVENQPLVLASPSADMTNGNGTGTLTLAYSIVSLTSS